MNYFKIFLAVGLMVFFQACLKEISLKPQPYQPKLVIESVLLPGTLPKLFLTRSTPYFNLDITPFSAFVNDARVVISGGGEEQVLQVDSIFDEFWCRWQPFYLGSIPTKEDVTYHLTVSRDGQTFTAQTTTDIKPVQLDSVTFADLVTDVFGGHQGVLVDFTDPVGIGNYYRYEMTRDVDSSVMTVDAFEYSPLCLGDATTSFVEVGRAVYSDENNDGLPSRIVVESALTFKKNDFGFVRLETLDKNAAEFFKQLDKQRLANINPFIEPVFLKPGQFARAIGLFGNMNLSEPVKFVFPKDED